MRVTEHFDSDEFKCHEGTPYPLDQADEDAPGGGTWLETRLRPLCETLETIRAQVGRPVTIDSGFRTVAYDQRLYDRSAHDGLVATPQGSQHPKGRAADIKVANVARPCSTASSWTCTRRAACRTSAASASTPISFMSTYAPAARVITWRNGAANATPTSCKRRHTLCFPRR
jgi:hypothetical protein